MAKSNETDAAFALRRLLKDVVKAGIGYDEILEKIDKIHGWKEASLRKFIIRTTEPRITSKVRGLAAATIELIELDQRLLELIKDNSLGAIKELAADLPEKYQTDSPGSNVQKIYGHLHEKSFAAYLPKKLAFARYARDRSMIVVVLVTIEKRQSGYQFTLKISGKGRRIVLGHVLHTQTSLYFTGIAFPITKIITDQEFYEMDGFNIDEIHRLGGHNELGLESFAIQNSDLPYALIPSCYYGLDGSGKPISGIGLIISEKEFDNLGIRSHVFSAVNCANKFLPLKNALDLANAVTALPPEDGAYELLQNLNSHTA